VKRADFLEHVGWTGGGIAFALIAGGTFAPAEAAATLSFVQISDSHIGRHARVDTGPRSRNVTGVRAGARPHDRVRRCGGKHDRARSADGAVTLVSITDRERSATTRSPAGTVTAYVKPRQGGVCSVRSGIHGAPRECCRAA
jgi:hypothetical protein